MTAETRTIIGSGIVFPIVVASNRSMGSEMCAKHLERVAIGNEMRSEIKALHVESILAERMNRLERDLRERLARVEGLFEGIRDSILGHETAGAP